MQKPIFVQTEISYIGHELQSTEVTKTVNKLIEDGYKVRVIVHEPIYDVGKAASFIIYNTTILAIRFDQLETVDIG